MKYTLPVITMTLALLPLVGCGSSDSSTDAVDAGTSSLNVIVLDESDTPLDGLVVTTQPETRTLSTDQSGTVVFEEIPAKTYSVTVMSSEVPSITRSVTLSADTPHTLTLRLVSTVTVRVLNDTQTPLPGIDLTLQPESRSATTGINGQASFTFLPENDYQIIASSPSMSGNISQNVTLDGDGQHSFDIIIPSGSPVVSITRPTSHITTIPNDNVFEGTGTDIEDGPLTGEQLKWTSSRDGEIGTGRRIVVPILSTGVHRITLTGTDSDGKTGTAAVYISIISYDPTSYFPLLVDTHWHYRYLEPEFSVVNDDNVVEHWTLDKLEVYIEDDLERISTVTYSIRIGMRTRQLKYELIDYFEIVDDDLYVVRTEETTSEWQNDDKANPFLVMNIETTYTPKYLVLKNSTEISAEPSYSHTIRAESSYSYRYYSNTSSVFSESFVINTSISVGEEEIVQTDEGLFTARKVTTQLENSMKDWWLAQGVGIVRLENNTFDRTTTALLNDTSILNYYNGKPAFSASMSYIPEKSAVSDDSTVRISRESAEGMSEIRNKLKASLIRPW